MVRSLVAKVVWVGRATVFLIGLAVVLAVALGPSNEAPSRATRISTQGLAQALGNSGGPTVMRTRAGVARFVTESEVLQ